MTDESAPDAPEFRFGDSVVIVDHNTTHRPTGTREFNFRVRRLGMVRVYRVDVPLDEVSALDQRELAGYLLRRARHRSLLFAYRDAQ